MSHEVETMMYTGETPWHRLGVKLDNAPSTADAIRAAGLEWTVSTEALAIANDGRVVSHRAVVRDSDRSILGVVGPKWHPLQNKEAFAWFDPFVASGEASIECAGSLRGGARVWILAKLARDPSVIVPGDEVCKYVLLANGHDGMMAAQVGFTPIRVVCANTLRLAQDASASKLLRVRHHKSIVDTLADVRDVMNTANARFEATADQYRALAHRQIDESDLKRYVDLVFRPNKRSASTAMVLASAPVVHDAEFIEEEETRKDRIFPRVQRLFESGRGNALPGVRGTLWAAYNAVTEYVQYERGADTDQRLDATWFGTGAALNARALSTASAMLTA